MKGFASLGASSLSKRPVYNHTQPLQCRTFFIEDLLHMIHYTYIYMYININRTYFWEPQVQEWLRYTFWEACFFNLRTLGIRRRTTIGTRSGRCSSSIRLDSLDKLHVVNSSLKLWKLARFFNCWLYGIRKSSFQIKRQSRTFICISASFSSKSLAPRRKLIGQTKGQNLEIIYMKFAPTYFVRPLLETDSDRRT